MIILAFAAGRKRGLFREETVRTDILPWDCRIPVPSEQLMESHFER
jgi:hypothetical protein